MHIALTEIEPPFGTIAALSEHPLLLAAEAIVSMRPWTLKWTNLHNEPQTTGIWRVHTANNSVHCISLDEGNHLWDHLQDRRTCITVRGWRNTGVGRYMESTVVVARSAVIALEYLDPAVFAGTARLYWLLYLQGEHAYYLTQAAGHEVRVALLDLVEAG